MIPTVLSRVRARPALHDAVVALGTAVVLLSITLSVALRASDSAIAVPAGLVVLTCLPLLVGSRWPVPVVLATAVLDVTRLFLIEPDFQKTYPTATVIALYVMAAHTGRRTAWRFAGAVVLSLTAVALIARPGVDNLPMNLGVLPWTCLPVAISDGVRSRREVLAAATERAERAERTREDVALRRVTEERVRIARELHDVVAHHITLVNAQAGVAHHLMRTDPEHAYVALERIRDTSRSALDELRATVGLLRQPGEAPSTQPAPGLADLDDLLERFRHSGLAVDLVTTGEPGALSATADLTAYRIIQEALTNTHKHAGRARARVCLDYAAAQVRITVEDDGRDAGTGAGIGYGLIGMHERARTAGGTLTAGARPAPETGFRVVGELPLSPVSSPAPPVGPVDDPAEAPAPGGRIPAPADACSIIGVRLIGGGRA
ncbi:sensor histidine kinase [Streptomyces liangshanensis]|uniref:histidine kinase n=1 Tax=Streptomyces liangshanensis TaxID=2717324 RepID=A0A6G9H638_9ACTN|nr:sensor histidine kinase [Streptomyces liangshanensis]QIQ06002.1 sensor histidine kinase [Streptomyces liangshanensis]